MTYSEFSNLLDVEDDVRVYVVTDRKALVQTLKDTMGAGGPGIKLQGFSESELPEEIPPSEVLLIDLSDEVSVLRALQIAAEHHAQAKVLLISPHDGEEWIRKVVDLGVSYCILRPVEPATIKRRMIQLARPEVQRQVIFQGELRRELIEQEVATLLSELGVPAHYKGCAYLKTAIRLAVQDESVVNRITHHLYPIVAQTHGVSPTHVERSMRHAIEVTWMRGNMSLINSLFAYTISEHKGKPTNGLFIARMADHLRLQARNLPSA